MLQRIIPRALGCVPTPLRRVLVGQPASPSFIATFLHNLLNRVRFADSEVFACHGALDGYRMTIDWSRFRGFLYGTWEPSVVRAITSTVKVGMSAVDAGAHIGYYTLLIAKCVGPSGFISSFEPLPANFELLKKNIQLNGLDNVQAFPEALASQIGDIIINVPPDLANTGDASIRAIAGARHLRVRGVALDSFCAQSGLRPDFIKIDVEGAEYDVLIGGQEVIARFRPTMLIELHHFDGRVASNPVPDLLAGWGYQVRWLDRADLTSHILATPFSCR